MPNVHIHLHVSKLDDSRAFYEKFLGAAPVKLKAGYAKFLPDFAPINLALSEGAVGVGAVDHVGIQVETPETVQLLLERVKASGIEVREEMGVDCCYANQDKFWVKDPDGLEWEVYYLNHDIETVTPVKTTDDATPKMCCKPGASCSTNVP